MRNFNESHLQECATGICLGGNIRLNHVKALLKEKALEVQRAPRYFYKTTEKRMICWIDQAASSRVFEAVESSYQELTVENASRQAQSKQLCRDSIKLL
jgi:hypothetical protein